MRIAEYKQIGTEPINETILVDDYDDNGQYIGRHEETITKQIPVMGVVYRDMTVKEQIQHSIKTDDIGTDTATIEDRVTLVQEHNEEQDMTIDDIVLLMADMIGGA